MVAAEQQVPGIKEASPVLNLHQRIAVNGGKEQDILVLGVDPQYKTVRRMVVSAGRFFDQQDAQSGNKVALITENLARTQFGSLDLALGQTIKINEVPFVIIGTFRESVDTLGRSEIADDTVLIPYTIARSMTGTPAVNQIYFSMYDSSSIPAATQSIQNVIAARHRPESVYNVNNMTEILAPGEQDGERVYLGTAAVCRGDLDCRRRGHHEHHAGDGARAHSRDWRAQSDWRDSPRDPAAVPVRSGDDCAAGRRGGNRRWAGHPHLHPALHQLSMMSAYRISFGVWHCADGHRVRWA